MPRVRAGAGAARQVLAALKAVRRSNLAAIFPASQDTGRRTIMTSPLFLLVNQRLPCHRLGLGLLYVFIVYLLCIIYNLNCLQAN